MLCTCNKRKATESTGSDHTTPCIPQETDCCHLYREHVNRIKSHTPKRRHWATVGVAPNKVHQPDVDSSECSPANQLMTCLKIGAEAERRHAVRVDQLHDQLEEVVEMNESLLEDLKKKDEDICSLKKDITLHLEENECLQRSINHLQNQSKTIEKDIASLEIENIKLKDANGKLRKEADKLRFDLDCLQKAHSVCLTEEEKKKIKEEVKCLKHQLNQALDKNAANQEKINSFKETNSILNVEVFNLNKQLEQELQKQCDISSSYKQKINELKHQIDVLEFDLESLKEDMDRKSELEMQLNEEIERLKQESALMEYEEEANLAIIDQLSEIIKNQEREMSKLVNCEQTKTVQEAEENGSATSCNQYNICSLLEQNNAQLQESEELLEEVCALKNNVLNYGDNLDKRGLMESIKDIRDRLMYRIEIEENKRDEVIESLDHLKREFAKTQEEIFYLRSKRQPNFKEDIQQRVQKEKELSYSICAAQQERRRICSQHDVLMKALVTLKKICGSS